MVLSGVPIIQDNQKTQNMSELVWGIKNGDLEQVKDIVEKKVGPEYLNVSCLILNDSFEKLESRDAYMGTFIHF